MNLEPLFPDGPTPPRVCGYVLRPLTLAHLGALHQASSPFLEAEGTPINPQDVVVAARICCITGDSFERLVETFAQSALPTWLRKYANDPAYWGAQIALMREHLRPAMETGLCVKETK